MKPQLRILITLRSTTKSKYTGGYEEWYTIWLHYLPTNQWMPLGKSWKKRETAEKWAKKIKDFHKKKHIPAVIKFEDRRKLK